MIVKTDGSFAALVISSATPLLTHAHLSPGQDLGWRDAGLQLCRVVIGLSMNSDTVEFCFYQYKFQTPI